MGKLRRFFTVVSGLWSIFRTLPWVHISSAVLLTALFAVTVWFSQLTFTESHVLYKGWKGAHLPLGWEIAVLRLLQQATSICNTFCVVKSLEAIQWTLIAKPNGTPMLTVLSLAPSTGNFGLLKYLYHTAPRLVERAWALSRLLLALAIIPLAGLVLFFNLSFTTVYEPTTDFNVTAGTGQFNGSFVAPTLATVNGSVSYWILASAYGFINNPEFSVMTSPIGCIESQGDCESYLFPGGLQTVSPNPPMSDPNPVVVVHGPPGIQLDFQARNDMKRKFTADDCNVYGDDAYIVALEVCVAEDLANAGSVIAEVLVCSNGTAHGQCRDTGPRLNVSTVVTAFSRTATTTSARNNNSILSVSELGAPTEAAITDLPALRLALGWLLNYTAADLPPASSLAFMFWNRSPGMTEHDWSVEAYKTLKSMLAFVLWEFSDNNYGNPQMGAPPPPESTGTAGSDGTVAFLPQEYHTTAAVCRLYTKFVIDKRMFKLYVALQGLPIVFCWVVVAWRLMAVKTPAKISSFPLVDILFKAKLAGAPISNTRSMRDAQDTQILRNLSKVNVHSV